MEVEYLETDFLKTISAHIYQLEKFPDPRKGIHIPVDDCYYILYDLFTLQVF